MYSNDVLTDNELKHQKIANKEASESIVLLKNDGTLPLKNVDNIALYGNGAEITLNGGTGSGEVHSRYDVSIKEGLEKKGFKITTNKWLEDYKNEYQKAIKKGNKVITRRILKLNTSNMINIIEGTTKYPIGRIITKEDIINSETDTCIYVIARQSGEARDRYLEEYTLTKIERENLKLILDNYKNVIVVINSGSTLEMEWLEECKKINSLIYYGQPGMEGGNALIDVLTGKVTPSGKLVDTWYKNYNDVPYAKEYGYLNKNKDVANYKENIYVGYRYIDSFNKDVAYHFGYGLSYTDFEIKFINITSNKSNIELKVNVKNIGNIYDGKEVVQIYLRFPNNKLEREYQSLVAFCKTKLLKPKEEEIITLKFNLSDFAYYDEKLASYILEKGKYVVRGGNSSNNIQDFCYINLIEDVVVEKCKNICPLKEKFDVLKIESKQDNLINENLPIINISEKDFESKTHNYNLIKEDNEMKKIVEKLSFEDKLNLITGTGLMGTNEVPGAYSTTAKLKEKGIGNLIMSDGPSGLRIHRRVGLSKKNKVVRLEENYSFLKGLPRFLKMLVFANPKKVKYKYQNITAFSAPSTLAHSWNIELAREVGKAIGEEMKEYEITHLLGPAINIHRNPLCGRNFEYFSEDPLLTSMMATSLSQGVQQVKGRYVTLKHFVANNQETRRTFMSSNIDERTLREIYLKAFKLVIREANIKSIMSSYNKLNGVYTCNSRDLCTTVLRDEFGFDGIVMTDWLSTGKSLANNGLAIASGNDLIMPGGKHYIKYLKRDYKKGLFTDDDLDKAVINILNIIKSNK